MRVPLIRVTMVACVISISVGCGDDEDAAPTVPGEAVLDLHEGVDPIMAPTYENVALLLRGDETNAGGLCAYSGCHSGPGRAGLTFRRDSYDPLQLYRALVERPATGGGTEAVQSCQYHPLRRVEPGDPQRSWLYIKIAGATDANSQMLLVGADDWDRTMSPCSTSFPFPGSLMPFTSDPEEEPVVPLEPAELRMVAEWILDGAPGPTAP